MKKTEERKWLRTSDDLYEKFAAELESGIETGEKVSSGDQDIKYGIELWRNRLNKGCLRIRLTHASGKMNIIAARFITEPVA